MSIRSPLLALLFAFASPAAGAQPPAVMSPAHPPSTPTLDAALAEHFKGIVLTDRQIRQLTAIRAKHHPAMAARHHGGADQGDTAQTSEVQRRMAAEHEELLSVLTEAQRRVFDENMTGHHPLALGATRGPSWSLVIPFGLHIGIPQGAFAENVTLAGGVGGGLLWKVGGPFALRADFGVSAYGSERRTIPLGGGALSLIFVDVVTTNTIVGGSIGGQVGVPSRTIRPYLGGLLGFSAFTTTSSVEGSNSTNEPFASSTNANDVTFSTTALTGLYLPVGRSGNVHLDLGVRHTWHGERVRYLTEGSITEDLNGDMVIVPLESRADILTIVFGVTVVPNKSPKH